MESRKIRSFVKCPFCALEPWISTQRCSSQSAAHISVLQCSPWVLLALSVHAQQGLSNQATCKQCTSVNRLLWLGKTRVFKWGGWSKPCHCTFCWQDLLSPSNYHWASVLHLLKALQHSRFQKSWESIKSCQTEWKYCLRSLISLYNMWDMQTIAAWWVK